MNYTDVQRDAASDRIELSVAGLIAKMKREGMITFMEHDGQPFARLISEAEYQALKCGGDVAAVRSRSTT